MMDRISKSEIVRKVADSFEGREPLSISCILKNQATIVRIKVEFEEQETFIDKNGVKWVKES